MYLRSITEKRKLPSNTCEIFFDNKINLPSIFHDPLVGSSIHGDKNSFEITAVVYNRDKPIHSRIFVFNKLLLNLGVDRYLQDKTMQF